MNYKFPVEERDTASIIIDHSGPPPDMYDVQVNHRVLICIMYRLTIEYNYVRCTGKPWNTDMYYVQVNHRDRYVRCTGKP